ncbi:MAG TPA: isochorismatase family protein [Stellaceae bacterium]|nr:isochorismatase family protein [Stellaceae bacterium]
MVDCQARLVDQFCAAPEALRDNLLGLARLARAFSMPIVIGTRRGAAYGPLLAELAQETAGAWTVERPSGRFWDHAASVAAVRACGRRDLLVAGIDPDSGLAGLSLGAREEGFAVQVVADAAAGGTPSSERIGVARMSEAGIRVTSWVAVMAEFASATPTKPAPADSAALSDSLARYPADETGWGRTRITRFA